MKDILIIGAGGVGRETAMLIEEINRNQITWNLKGFIDDNPVMAGIQINGYSVLGGSEYLNSIAEETFVICTISNPKAKKNITHSLTNPLLKYATLIHPSAIISKDCEIGMDVIIQAYCVITTNVRIGNHVQINPQCGIGHESTILDYCSLYWNVNISGSVTVGEGCLWGTKSTVIQGLKVGAGSIIGASANVIRDVPPGCTVVGNPARPIKSSEGGTI